MTRPKGTLVISLIDYILDLFRSPDVAAAFIADPDGAVAATYREIARKVAVSIARKSEDFSAKFPSIKVVT